MRGARLAFPIALGLAVSAALWLGFIPVVETLYAARGSPAVTTDSGLLGLLALVANMIVLAVVLVAQGREPGKRER